MSVLDRYLTRQCLIAIATVIAVLVDGHFQAKITTLNNEINVLAEELDEKNVDN